MPTPPASFDPSKIPNAGLVGQTRVEWNGTDKRLRARMGDYGEAVKEGLLSVGQRLGPAMEAFAKQNAPWTDRTGHARQGLRYFVDQQDDGQVVVVTLAHGEGIFYGWFLEVRFQGRYAIILPTLQAHYPIARQMLLETFSE